MGIEMRLWTPFIFLLLFSSFAFAVDCEAGWTTKYVVAINSTVGTNLVNFPVRVSFNTSDGALWDPGTSCGNARAYDVNGVPMDYDIDAPMLCGNSSTNLTYWALYPNLLANELNNITFCVGNIGVASGENETDVWRKANASAVYHFSELATAFDSTGFNNISMSGTCTQVMGPYGYAVNLSDIFCYYYTTTATNLPQGNANSTESVWLLPQDLTPVYEGTFMYGGGTQLGLTARSMYVNYNGNGHLTYAVYGTFVDSGLVPTQDI